MNQQEQAYDDPLMAAYAEGRKDEREEWLPVLKALKRFVATYGENNVRKWMAIRDEAAAAIASVDRKEISE